MKGQSRPTNLNPILDGLYYSVDQWIKSKHQIKGVRRSVCNGFIVDRMHVVSEGTHITDVVTNSLRIKLELYNHSANGLDEIKYVVLRFGHPRCQTPVVLSESFSKYTKRKTIKSWVKKTIISLSDEVNGAKEGFSTRATPDNLFT